MIVGQPQRGATPVNLAADVVRGISVTLADPAYLSHLAVLLDGLGPGVGEALVRGVVFDSTGALIARGDEVAIADGAPAEWVQLPMGDAAGTLLEAGSYRFGMHVGGPTNCARTHVDDPGAGSWSTPDTYIDGTSSLPAGPGVAFLAGSATGSAAASGTVRATPRITAAAAAAGASSATLGVGSGAVVLSGVSTATGTATATIRVTPRITGAAAAAASASATLSTSGALSGTSTGSGTASGSLSAGTSTYGAAVYGTSTYASPPAGSVYGTGTYGAATYG